MTREQIAEGQKLARDFTPREVPPTGGESSAAAYCTDAPGIFRHWLFHHGGWVSHYQ